MEKQILLELPWGKFGRVYSYQIKMLLYPASGCAVSTFRILRLLCKIVLVAEIVR